jgi:TonB family protein
VVFSAYYHAWITPDNAASRLGAADAKVTIARDGSILFAELVRPSDDKGLDRSVERALREVTKLPPFPASTRDTQRTYVIRFSLEAKEMTG